MKREATMRTLILRTGPPELETQGNEWRSGNLSFTFVCIPLLGVGMDKFEWVTGGWRALCSSFVELPNVFIELNCRALAAFIAVELYFLSPT